MRMRREPMTREVWIALAILGPVIFLGLFLLMFIDYLMSMLKAFLGW
jgi:hypothetical protein